MAFGQTLIKPQTANKTTADGEPAQQFTWQWIPVNGGNATDNEPKGGNRRIRLLPELDNEGNLVKPMEAATETRFLEVWLPVTSEGQQKRGRIILDWRKPWSNPYWELVAKPTEKGSQARTAMRQKFALNVLDRTPVYFTAEGVAVYPDENGAYRLNPQGKIIQFTPDGKPTPLNQVRILEQTTGDPGGKHFFQLIVDAIAGLEDGDGNTREPYEVDLQISVKGIDKMVRRGVRALSSFSKLDDVFVFAPRYNLEQWLRPWPDEAVIAVINGADFNEVVTTFGLTLYPELKVQEKPEEELFDN